MRPINQWQARQPATPRPAKITGSVFLCHSRMLAFSSLELDLEALGRWSRDINLHFICHVITHIDYPSFPFNLCSEAKCLIELKFSILNPFKNIPIPLHPLPRYAPMLPLIISVCGSPQTVFT